MATTLEALKILAANLYDNFDIIPGSHLIKDYIKRSYQHDPFRVALEALLLFFALKYLTNKKYQLNSNYVKLTEKEINDLVDEWKPEPLVADSENNNSIKEESLLIKECHNNISKFVSKFHRHSGLDSVLPDGTRLQNWSVANFAGLHNNDEMKKICVETIKGYGVGTCGPSGFYGTIDIHLDLQKELSKALGTEGAIIYAQGYSAISSVIPAFSKKGDIIVADECVNFAIQRGLTLSKSQVHFYKHNDMRDLELILIKLDSEQKKRKTPLTRKFIISEGLFANSGTIVNLPELVQIKKKYKYRLILDESLSFGTLGSRCSGVTNLFNVPSTEIDIIAGSLSNSLGSAGGFCAGDKNIVDHQVLSSQAYCYSASLPAFLASAAVTNLQQLSKNGNNISIALSENMKTLRKEFSPYPAHMELMGSNNSPLLYLAFNENYDCDQIQQRSVLNAIVKDMRDSNKILLTMFTSVEKDEKFKHRPMIKIAISAGFSTEQVRSFAAQLRKTANKFIKN